MSEKAPNRLGGTRPNVEERFGVLTDTVEGDERTQATAEDHDEHNVTIMESLCMHCKENGNTSLLLTSIPYFREIILMSFECEHCGFRNSEVQFGGTIQEKGCKIEFHVENASDLNRQIIKADTATVFFPELEFEIPPKTQRGTINTIEGLLQKAIENLQMNQEERREIDPETTAKLDEFIQKLALLATGITLPFKIIIDDPAGNSHIENPHAPQSDPKMKVTQYYRSEAQDLQCGLQPDTTHDVPTETPKVLPPQNKGLDKFVEEANIAKKEVIQFPVNCHSCQTKGNARMCVTDIPHFKEVIIMAFNCEHCGFRSNEVKAGGSIPSFGERITLRADISLDPEVLNRDILKSDSASVVIPELELELVHGSLGGLYTTVEGLLDRIRQNIEEGNPFAVGDSDGGRSQLKTWLERLQQMKEGQKPFTLILEDPLANSFLYSPHGTAENDPLMTAEKYQRTEAEDQELGISDMVTEGYSQAVDAIQPTESGVRKSDKETMERGGMALDSAKYHPNPKAVQQCDSKSNNR
ncbi:unnamed protein product [Albugo candida]|uniref:Zinc finger ZPR1-type domain-containing protein n=1 Tax=Albugo candida TaxID=65357 RepID=A0A024GIE5_9STRA|nr:unnamed protein product [Albugo candida]|eukprot:CCI46297.1 unnamed protein product [Albugo candida]